MFTIYGSFYYIYIYIYIYIYVRSYQPPPRDPPAELVPVAPVQALVPTAVPPPVPKPDEFTRLMMEAQALLSQPGMIGKAYLGFCKANMQHHKDHGGRTSPEAQLMLGVAMSLGAAVLIAPGRPYMSPDPAPELPPCMNGAPPMQACARDYTYTCVYVCICIYIYIYIYIHTYICMYRERER